MMPGYREVLDQLKIGPSDLKGLDAEAIFCLICRGLITVQDGIYELNREAMEREKDA
jgi:hypothetical protein